MHVVSARAISLCPLPGRGKRLSKLHFGRYCLSRKVIEPVPGPEAARHEAEFTQCLYDRQVFGNVDVGTLPPFFVALPNGYA